MRVRARINRGRYLRTVGPGTVLYRNNVRYWGVAGRVEPDESTSPCVYTTWYLYKDPGAALPRVQIYRRSGERLSATKIASTIRVCTEI